jgi:hypothetical protein
MNEQRRRQMMLSIGQIVLWKIEEGQTQYGHVVGFDDEMVAVCFVETLKEGGNIPHPNPILFVDRRDVTPVPKSQRWKVTPCP